ncbi:MAG: cation transporter [Clostridia bacterium]|nr:cation transporter [Clostridia bacterium]
MKMISKLIKDYDNPKDPNVRIRVGRFSGFVGIFANIVLFAVKIIFGIIFGSVSIIADSLNNFSDAGSNILTVVGYTLTGKPADKEHPYGHARMEYLCSLFISIIVMVLGIETLKSSIEKLIHPHGATEYSTVAIIVITSTVGVKIFMAILNLKLGKHIDSDALKATALDSISDVIATLAVVIGMVLTPYLGVYTDGVLGCIISVYILALGIKMVFESSNTLLGKAPDAQFSYTLTQKIKSYDGVLGIHDLVIHSYGANKCFASAHIEVDSEENVMLSHDMIDTIEADILKEMNVNLVIHMDPVCMTDAETNDLREKCSKIISNISAEYSSPVSMHDFRVVKGYNSQTKIIFDISVSNDIPVENERLYKEISEEIRKINPLYAVILTVDRDYFSTRYENI